MKIDKVKISQLPLIQTLRGFFTLGIGADGRNYKVDLGFIQDVAEESASAAENARSATQGAILATDSANTATISATNAAESANSAADNANNAVVGMESTYAKIASPTFTGVPKAPTPLTSDSSTQLATTAFVQAVAAGGGGGSGARLIRMFEGRIDIIPAQTFPIAASSNPPTFLATVSIFPPGAEYLIPYDGLVGMLSPTTITAVVDPINENHSIAFSYGYWDGATIRSKYGFVAFSITGSAELRVEVLHWPSEFQSILSQMGGGSPALLSLYQINE